MSDEEITFESAEAGSADCVPIRAGELKKGMHVVIKGHPCKIVDISTSKTGKHGHAKANITALDIFTDRKYEDVAPTSANMSAPLGACRALGWGGHAKRAGDWRARGAAWAAATKTHPSLPTFALLRSRCSDAR